MDKLSILGEYGTDILPSCPCFTAEPGAAEIPDQGASMLAGAVMMGESAAHSLMVSGVCPTAFPMALAEMVVSALLHASYNRRSVEPGSDILDVMPEVRRMADEMQRLLPLCVDRVEKTVVKRSAAGSC